jgi:predicted PurR-regulated permease PerM
MQKLLLPFYARLALVLLSIVLIIYLLYIGQGVFIPLFFAIFLSFLLYPFCAFLEKRFKLSRGLSALLVVFCFVLLTAAFLYFFTFQILAFTQEIPQLQHNVNKWLVHVQEWITKEYHVDSTMQVEYMNQALNGMLNSASASLGTIFLSVAGTVFWIVIIFIYTYFILHHRRLLRNFVIGIFPPRYNDKVEYVVTETRSIVKYYLLGLLIEFVIIAFAIYIIFLLLGIKYAMLLALIAALLNFIPYLGIITSSLLIFLVTIAHSSPALAIQATALRFILHILDANILMPKVVGNKVKMNALITIIAVLIGGAIWGVAGMFLFIPITAILKAIFQHIEDLKPWAYVMGSEDNKKISEMDKK